MATLLIKNGTVVGPSGAVPADVLVDGEKIVSLSVPGTTVTQTRSSMRRASM